MANTKGPAPRFHPQLPTSLDRLTPEALLPPGVLAQLQAPSSQPMFTHLQLHCLMDQLLTFRQLSRCALPARIPACSGNRRFVISWLLA